MIGKYYSTKLMVNNTEGPFTVFVPSNDALQKVPDTDLEVIRRNMTALRGEVEIENRNNRSLLNTLFF